MLVGEFVRSVLSHKVDRRRVMNFYPISFPGIVLLPSAVMPIKDIRAEDSKHKRHKRRQGRSHTRSHTHKWSHTRSHTHTHTQMLTNVLTSTQNQECYKLIWTNILKNVVCARAHTRIDTHTYIHTSAFAHTYNTHTHSVVWWGSGRTDCLFQLVHRLYWFFPHSSLYTPYLPLSSSIPLTRMLHILPCRPLSLFSLPPSAVLWPPLRTDVNVRKTLSWTSVGKCHKMHL